MGFAVGARVLVDGQHQAIVKQFFPEGSSSFLFPHYTGGFYPPVGDFVPEYKLDFVGGDRNVAVTVTRVGPLPRLEK